MLWLLLILHPFIGTAMAGSFMIVALTMGYDAMLDIVIAAGAGFALSFPISRIVAKRLYDLR